MAEGFTEFRRYAGRVLFPRTPNDLVDALTCPACLSAVSAPVCGACGLDLQHPAIAELATLSTDAAALLDRRLDLIGRIRYDTELAATTLAAAQAAAMVDQAIAGPAVANPAVASPAVAIPAVAISGAANPAADGPTTSAPLIPVSGTSPDPVPSPPGTAPIPVIAHGSPPMSSPLPARDADAPKRSSIQVLLVVVGISLLSIAAIFFLVYAFITWGLLARSIIIGAITIAAIVGASELRRRRLPATAEGVSMFAVVLLYLDAFAVRGNDLFAAGTVDPRAYWGWSLVVTAVGFVAWSRFTRLRTPGIVAFAAVAPGVGLVAASLSSGLATAFVFATALSIVGAIHRAAPRLLGRAAAAAERTVAMIIAAVGIIVAGVTAFAVGSSWGVTTALTIVAAVSAGHIALLDLRTSPLRTARAVGMIFAVVGAFALTAALPVGVLAIGSVTASVVLPLLIGIVVTLLIEALWRLSRGTTAASHLLAATIASAVTTILLGLAPVGVLIVSTLAPPTLALASSWRLSPTDPIALALPISSGAALATVAGAALLAAGAWWFGGVIRRRVTALTWLGCTVLVFAASTLPALWAMLTAWEALAFAAIIAVTVTDARGRLTAGVRAALLSTAFAASALAYATGWASMDTWQLVSLAVIVVLLAVRLFFGPVTRPVLLGLATLVLVVMGAAGARDLALPLHPTANADLVNVFRATGFVGILLLGLVAFLRLPALRARDRRVLFWVAAVTIATSTTVSQWALLQSGPADDPGRLLPEYATSLAVCAFLIAALLCCVLSRTAHRLAVERLIAGAAIPAALYWFVDSLARTIGVDEMLLALAPAIAALLAAAGSLALQRASITTVGPRSGSTQGRIIARRRAIDVGVVLVAISAVTAPLTIEPDAEWLALLLTAGSVLMAAVAHDGLFGSVSPRRHLGWVALALATTGLWMGLAQADVRPVEPYVLPLSAALIAIAIVGSRLSAPRGGSPTVGLSQSGAQLGAQSDPQSNPQSSALSDARSIAQPNTRLAGMSSLQFPAIALAGLLVAVVPETVVGTAGPVLRPILVGAACAVLAIGASWISTASSGSASNGTASSGTALNGMGRAQRFADVAAFAGALGVAIVTVTQSAALIIDASGVTSGQAGRADARLEAWLVPGVAALVIAAVGQARPRGGARAATTTTTPAAPARATPTRAIVAQGMLAITLVAAVLVELPALYPDAAGFARAATLIVLLCAAFIGAVAMRRSPLTAPLGWLAFALAAIVAAAALVAGAFGELELATVPLAAAAIAAGGIHLSRSATAGTWPTLAPGVALLLIPSLVVTAVDAPLWRLVGLGAAAIAVLVVALVLRLQAPFLLAAAVLLTHSAATFAPQIVAVYQAVEWWLWLAIGGVIVLVVSIRFENSRRGVKAVIGRIAALR